MQAVSIGTYCFIHCSSKIKNHLNNNTYPILCAAWILHRGRFDTPLSKAPIQKTRCFFEFVSTAGDGISGYTETWKRSYRFHFSRNHRPDREIGILKIRIMGRFARLPCTGLFENGLSVSAMISISTSNDPAKWNYRTPLSSPWPCVEKDCEILYAMNGSGVFGANGIKI